MLVVQMTWRIVVVSVDELETPMLVNTGYLYPFDGAKVLSDLSVPCTSLDSNPAHSSGPSFLRSGRTLSSP